MIVVTLNDSGMFAGSHKGNSLGVYSIPGLQRLSPCTRCARGQGRCTLILYGICFLAAAVNESPEAKQIALFNNKL